MDKIKVDSVIIGKSEFDTIVSNGIQISVPKTYKANDYVGKNVNISFDKDVKISEAIVEVKK